MAAQIFEHEPELFLDNFVFTECPRWHADRLWFSDIWNNKVHRADLAGNLETIAEIENKPSGLGFLPDGRLLICSMMDRKVLRREDDGALVVHADLSSFTPYPINDMIVDRFGRAYIGQFGGDVFAGEPPKESCVFLVTPDGTVQEMAHGVKMPNGMALTPDQSQLILAQSEQKCLSLFDIEEDGMLVNQRLFAESEYRPDGICLDAEGCVWMAAGHKPPGDCFVRVAEGGEVLARIKSDSWRGIACTTGGPDRRSLFLLEVKRVLPSKMGGPGNSRIRKLQIEVPGAGLP